MAISRARLSMYAGWVLGGVAVVSAGASTRVGGAFFVLGGILISLAMSWGVVEEELRRRPERRMSVPFVRKLGTAIGLGWVVLGTAMLVGG